MFLKPTLGQANLMPCLQCSPPWSPGQIVEKIKKNIKNLKKCLKASEAPETDYRHFLFFKHFFLISVNSNLKK